MILLKNLLESGDELRASTEFKYLQNSIITVYHGSRSYPLNISNSNREENSPNIGMHVGSIQQAYDIAAQTKHRPYYIYQFDVVLNDLHPELQNEDPAEEIEMGELESNNTQFAYINRNEHVSGLKIGKNISIYLLTPKNQIKNIELIKTIN